MSQIDAREENFVRRFVLRGKRDRARFLLASKKRRDFMSALCHHHHDWLVGERMKIVSGSNFDAEFLEEINKHRSKFGYGDIVRILTVNKEDDGKEISLDDAVVQMRNATMAAIAIIDEHNAYFVPELSNKRIYFHLFDPHP